MSGVSREPLLWPLGAAVVLLFLVPSALAALLPLGIVGLIGLRRPVLVVMIIPVTFPFHDVTSPAAHLHLDRTALLIGVALLATFGHASAATASASSARRSFSRSCSSSLPPLCSKGASAVASCSH
ncbi:MAG: hypothetical protein LC748_16720 [Thermomicrobia bacterium]|nr:hypothetical protein [Thermomicrobia bacterium]